MEEMTMQPLQDWMPAAATETPALDNAPTATIVQHLWFPTGQPTDLRVPAAFEGLPAVRIVGVRNSRGTLPAAVVLASNQEGTLLGELVTHANAIEARRDEVRAHRWHRPDGTATPWRDGAPPAKGDDEGEVELAFAVRAPGWGGDRALDPIQPARWCAVLDELVNGPLAGVMEEGGMAAELARLRSWIEREADPQLRRQLFESGAIAGPTRIPVARTASSSTDPSPALRGYDDGWNAFRLLVAHAAAGAPLPPPRASADAMGGADDYSRGYDHGWNACLQACHRLGVQL